MMATSPHSPVAVTQALVVAGLIAAVLGQFDENIRVPLGVMYDTSAQSEDAAVEYKIFRHNDNDHRMIKPGRVQLRAVAKRRHVDMKDVYSTNTEFCDLIQKGVFAVLGTHTSSTIDALMAYTSALHMPLITPRLAVNMTAQELGYGLFLRPYYAQAVIDVIEHYKWPEVWYMLVSDDGLMRLQQLFEALSHSKYVLKINILRVKDAQSGYEAITAIDKRMPVDKRILLDMPLKESETMLNLEHSSPRNVRHHYFLMELGINEIELKFFEYGGMNVTGFRMFDYNNPNVSTYLREWEMWHNNSFTRAGRKLTHDAAFAIDGVQALARALARLKSQNPNVLKQTVRSDKVVYNGSYEVTCDAEPIVQWSLGYDLMKAMRERPLQGLTGHVAFDKYGLRTEYSMEVLAVTNNMALAHIATWSDTKGLVRQSPALVRVRPVHVAKNRTRIVTSILTEPFLSYNPEAPGEDENRYFEGYCADLARKLLYDIDYKIVTVKDGKYGGKDENGTWNGMVGELIRGDADLSIAPLTITAEREQYIDFSKPFMSLGISIMIKKPTNDAPGVFSFMYPLSYEIWMCVVFAYIGVSVVLFLVSRFSPFEWHIEDNTDGPTVTNNFSIFNSLWFALGAFMQQGCDIEPRSMSGRIVGSVWWFFTLIIISSYTANLAAFLTVERMHSTIESAEDLAKQTEIKYGTVESGSTMEFFKGSSIAVYKRMWAFMSSAEESVFVKSNAEGIRRVRESNGKYAFLVESTTNDYTNQRRPCDTMNVGNNLDSKGYGIGTPLGSDIKDKVTLRVLELREKGELTKMETKWWYTKGACGTDNIKKQGETTNSLKLSNVAGIFYILIGGLTLALLMAALEFLYKSNTEARRRKTSFTNAVRTKARLSIKGKPDHRHSTAYTYTPAAQLITFDGYAEANTHTQV